MEDAHWRPAAYPHSEETSVIDDSSTVVQAVGPRDHHAQWWLLWNDAALNELEQRALLSNQSIVHAEASYRQARALVSEARSSLFPSASFVFDPSRDRVADYESSRARYTYYTVTDVHASVEARWELDLWGKARRSLEAATDSGQAEAAIGDAVKLSVTAELAQAYLYLRQSDLDLHALRTERQAYLRIVNMTRLSHHQGLVTDDEVLQTENALSEVETQIDREESARSREEHAIAALVGVAPEKFSIASVPDYRFACPDIAPILPSALLERRPDIVAAERRAAAANAEIGVAQSAYFPDVLLGAGIGGEGATLLSILSAPARVWSLGPSLAMSLFDAGRNRARVQGAHADYDAAAASYRATVINALQEVEDGLAQQREGDRVADSLRQVFQRSKQLNLDQKAQRRVGIATDLSVVQSDIIVLNAQRRWQAATASAALYRVVLVRDIGGGWEGFER
ncbi:NodT family efflux transporter outer membrane factor (OMF) lipoprotein [Paraburkholderia caledonica]|uniref:NodT family efflux transporter outer membrane factor (OMF) lipoprotein n=2 Tax=Paraburkholderia caledonica TaxID=134536 RepID=A0AB73INE9_9BURK|nr:NodT family efflux transporter outer membrane factor (OMF) lipoprotein [Paraburkholderia caledonica]